MHVKFFAHGIALIKIKLMRVLANMCFTVRVERK